MPWIRDDTLITRGTTTIGVIGSSTVQTPTTTRAANVAGLRFDGPAPVVSARAKALRERGADLIVVIAHAGAFCNATGTDACQGEIIDVARNLTEKVDAIVSGHTHSLVVYAVNGIPIVQARSSGRAVAVIDIPEADGKPAGAAHAEVRDVVDSAIVPDAAADSLARRATPRVTTLVNRKVAETAGTLDREGSQYPLGNLIADTQRWAAKGDIAIMNRDSIDPLPNGPAKTAARERWAALRNGVPLRATRVYIGRDATQAAVLNLFDRNGKPRLRLRVDSLGMASLEFLDETGTVTSRLP